MKFELLIEKQYSTHQRTTISNDNWKMIWTFAHSIARTTFHNKLFILYRSSWCERKKNVHTQMVQLVSFFFCSTLINNNNVIGHKINKCHHRQWILFHKSLLKCSKKKMSHIKKKALLFKKKKVYSKQLGVIWSWRNGYGRDKLI